MKYRFFSLCLFIFIFFTPIPARAMDKEEISMLSAALSQQRMELSEKQKSLKKKTARLKKQKDRLEQEIDQLQKQLDPGFQKGKLLALTLQQGKFPDLFEYLTLLETYEALSRLDCLKERLDVQIKKIEGYQNELNDLENLLKQIDADQARLQEMFSGPELKESDAAPEASILGPLALPNTGSVSDSDSIDLSACLAGLDVSFLESSNSLLWPVEHSSVSAGTWAYPGGGLHLGMDFASPMYSNIYAPANGVIVYASAPVSSSNGYLGNYCGYPAGGGNTVAMIADVNGSLYAITFAHLSSTLYVRPGQIVSQSDVIALSGNSGNSTGPHTHIEVFKLKTDLEQAVAYFASGTDFSFGCGWKQAGTSSRIAVRIRPESVF